MSIFLFLSLLSSAFVHHFALWPKLPLVEILLSFPIFFFLIFTGFYVHYPISGAFFCTLLTPGSLGSLVSVVTYPFPDPLVILATSRVSVSLQGPPFRTLPLTSSSWMTSIKDLMRSKDSIAYFCIIYCKSNNRIVVYEDKSRFSDVHTFLPFSFFSPLCPSGNTSFQLFVHYVNQYACWTLDQKQSPTDSAINLYNHFHYPQFFVFSPPIITLSKAV